MNETHIRREGGRAWLEGVPQLAWGRQRDCTFAGALEAALAQSEWPVDYDSIMGWSGLAFRLRWYQGDAGLRWCMSSPVGEFPDEVAATRRATGWTLPLDCRIDRQDPNMGEFAPKIVAEIDAGRPVLTYDSQLNMAVIFGYADHGHKVLVRSYSESGSEHEISVGEIGPMIAFLGECGQSLSPKDALLEGIRIGTENWHRGSEPAQNGRYWHGHAAYLKWREDLHNADGLADDEAQQLRMVSAWVFGSLRDARAAALRFLRTNVELLDGSRHRHANAAAEAFSEQSALLRSVAGQGCAFQSPDDGLGRSEWAKTMRDREVELLDRLLELESPAIGELENLLDAAEIHEPAVH